MGRLRGEEAKNYNWATSGDIVKASDFKTAFEELKVYVFEYCPPWSLGYARSGSLGPGNNVWDLKVERNNGQDPSKLNYHIKLDGNP